MSDDHVVDDETAERWRRKGHHEAERRERHEREALPPEEQVALGKQLLEEGLLLARSDNRETLKKGFVALLNAEDLLGRNRSPLLDVACEWRPVVGKKLARLDDALAFDQYEAATAAALERGVEPPPGPTLRGIAKLAPRRSPTRYTLDDRSPPGRSGTAT